MYNFDSQYLNLSGIIEHTKNVLKLQHSLQCYKEGYALFCRPCPKHPHIDHDAIMFDYVTPIKENFHHFVAFTCAYDPSTYFDLLAFDENEINALKQAVPKLSVQELEDARYDLLARHYVIKKMKSVVELEKIHEQLFGKAPKDFTKEVRKWIEVIEEEAPLHSDRKPLEVPDATPPSVPVQEMYGIIVEEPKPNVEWLKKIWWEFVGAIKQGDPKALQFKEMLKSAVRDIEDSLNPSTVCEYVDAVFLCEPCPKHHDKSDTMIIYPSYSKTDSGEIKKSIYFCLKDPDAKFNDPYTIPEVSYADSQVLETYGKLIWKQWRDYHKGEAEVIARYYKLYYSDKTGLNTARTLATIYEKIFGKKASAVTLSYALDKILPPAQPRKSSVTGIDLSKIEPDPSTKVDKWEFTVDELYSKVVGFYNFKECYKIGYMLFCRPCPLHPNKNGDMLVLDPLARVGALSGVWWTCTYDPYFYNEELPDYPRMPKTLRESFDELLETYTKRDIEESRAELMTRYFALVFSPDPRDFGDEVGRRKLKMIITPIYHHLFHEEPTEEVLDQIVGRLARAVTVAR